MVISNSGLMSTASHTNMFAEQTCLPALTYPRLKRYFPFHDGLRRGLSCSGTESPSNARSPAPEPGSIGAAARTQPGVDGQYRSRPSKGALALALADCRSASFEVD